MDEAVLTQGETSFANDMAAKYQPLFALNGWVWGYGVDVGVPTREQLATRLMTLMVDIKAAGSPCEGRSSGRFTVVPVWGSDPKGPPRGWIVTVGAGSERYYAGHELYDSETAVAPSDVVPDRWTCSMVAEHCIGGQVDSPIPGPPGVKASSLESGQLE